MVATEGDDTLEILTGTSIDGLGGNDTLTGSAFADTIAGGKGDDILRGAAGNDIYEFGLGDGQDRIEDTEGQNTLVLGIGIAPADVQLVRGKETIILEIIGTGDRIDLGTDANSAMPLREVQFEDGSIWTAQMLVDMALSATAGDDVIFGTNVAETLVGDEGDDRLIAFGGADDLAGGAGVDLLEGGEGDDTYRFNLGDDQDRIEDTGGDTDILVLGAGILPEDIRVAQSSDGSAIVLAIGDEGDRIRIDNALEGGRIEVIRFDDGTEWNVSDLIERVATSLDDFIFGDDTANILAGGFGDDRLTGNGGDDTYRFAAGDGRDIIRDGASSANDKLIISGYTVEEIRFNKLGIDTFDIAIQFEGSDDQIIVANALRTNGSGIEEIILEDDGTIFTATEISARLVGAQSTSDNDVIIGSDFADILTGGAGNDLVVGARGDDIFTYAIGDGDDRFDATGGGMNEVVLVGYTQDDVESALRAGPESNDLVLDLSTPGDRLVLIGALGDDNGAGFDLIIRFADDTTWDRSDMRVRALETIQTDNDDNIYGFSSDDVYDMSIGDDYVAGGEGADTYIFELGDGNDRIEDMGTDVGDTDVLQLVGFQSTDASVSRLFRGSETILMEFAGNNSDSLTLIDALAATRCRLRNMSSKTV